LGISMAVLPLVHISHKSTGWLLAQMLH